MKKLLTFLIMFILSISVGWAEETTFTLTGLASSGSVEWTGATQDGVTLTASVGSNNNNNKPQYYYNGDAVRFYQHNRLTVSVSSGTITKIEFTGSSLGNFNTGDVGSYSNGTWSGNENEVLFYATTAARLKTVKVTYTTGGSTQPTTYALNDESSNGSVAFTVGSNAVTVAEAGATVTATATAADGYEFSSWSVPSNVTNWDDNGNVATFTMPSAAVTVSANFTKTQTTPIGDYVFYESFNQCSGSGGNSGGFSTNPTGSPTYDNSGWQCESIGAGDKCVKTGSGSKSGAITTPEISGLTIGEQYTLTFKAAPYGTSDGTSLSLSATGGSFSSASLEMEQSQWTEYTVTFTASATSTTITFSPAKRFWLDEVKLEGEAASAGVGAPSIAFGEFTDGDTQLTATITPGSNATATYYRVGESGEYVSVSGSVTIDLTTTAAPIKVYAYSTDGTDNSATTEAQFGGYPTLSASITPAGYSGYDAQTVTLAAAGYIGTATITYTINGGEVQSYSEPFTVSAVGEHVIVATVSDQRAGGSPATATATITIAEQPSGNVEEATYIFNTDEGLAALDIEKPSSGDGTYLGDENTYTVDDVTLSALKGTASIVLHLYKVLR